MFLSPKVIWLFITSLIKKIQKEKSEIRERMMNASLFAEFAISLNFKIPLDMFSLRFGSDERKKKHHELFDKLCTKKSEYSSGFSFLSV